MPIWSLTWERVEDLRTAQIESSLNAEGLKVLEVWKVPAKTDLKPHWLCDDWRKAGLLLALTFSSCLAGIRGFVAARHFARLFVVLLCTPCEETAQREDHGVDRFTKHNSRGSLVRRTPIWSDTLQMLGLKLQFSANSSLHWKALEAMFEAHSILSLLKAAANFGASFSKIERDASVAGFLRGTCGKDRVIRSRL